MEKIKPIPNVNLDHHVPSDSLLTTTDYHEIEKSEDAQYHRKEYLEFRDFQFDPSGFSIWDRLRKPEFQRQTNSWIDEKYINLLKTLKSNQVIPGVIFWLNTATGHIFVLDGAHRLSAIRAWVTDDWGDSDEAKEYGYLEEDELRAAKRLRQRIKEEIGDYEECRKAQAKFKKIVDARKNPKDELDDETEARGRFMYHLNTSLKIPIQWVTGGYQDAEQSFVNINTGGTPLTSEEALYIENRRSPVARALTGIISNGSKPSLWIKHEEKCTEYSKEIYKILLAPSDNIPTKMKITDYPLVLLKKQNSFDRYLFLQHLFSVVKHGMTGEANIQYTLTYLANEKDENLVASETLKNLEQLISHLSHLRGNNPNSLGLVPAFYFYSTKGQYNQVLFLSFTMWLLKGSKDEIRERKLLFAQNRDVFESLWLTIKDSIIKYLGRKGGPSRLSKNQSEFFDKLLETVSLGKKESHSTNEIATAFLNELGIKLDQEKPGKAYAGFSVSTKTQQEMLAFFDGTYKCDLCGGAIDLGVSQQFDHIEKRSEGGNNSVKNGRVVHPWCNNNRDKLNGGKGKEKSDLPIAEDPPQFVPKPELIYIELDLD